MTRATTNRIDWNAVKEKLRAAQRVHEQSSTVDEDRVLEIFRKRAERLAAGISHPRSMATTPVLVFRVGDETYGVDLRYVAQVFPDTPITPVPGAPDKLKGVANLRGEVRSVFGLRRLLELSGSDDDSNRYILLLRQGDRHLGLQVEHIEGIRHIALDELIRGEDASADKRTGYVAGVTHDKVIMLRSDKFFKG